MRLHIFWRLLLIFGMTFLVLTPGLSQPPSEFRYTEVQEPQGKFEPPMYVCFRTDGYMRIDGKIDEEYWDKASWADDYRDIIDRDKKPSNRVRSKMLWDDTYLYVATEIKSKDIWAKSVKRDDILYLENAWEIFIDPDGSSHDYLELQINPFGTEWDLILNRPYRDGGEADSEWDIAGLLSLAQIYGTLNRPGDQDDKWTVEVAIPWRSMPDSGSVAMPPANLDQWRINMARVEWPLTVENNRYTKRKAAENEDPIRPEIAAWSSTGIFNLHYPEKWGIVQFSDSLAGKIHLRPEKREVDKLKWALRKIYYSQRRNYAISNSFSRTVDQLKLEKPNGKFEWPPELSGTDSSFVASLKLKDSDNWWQIDHLGRITALPRPVKSSAYLSRPSSLLTML